MSALFINIIYLFMKMHKLFGYEYQLYAFEIRNFDNKYKNTAYMQRTAVNNTQKWRGNFKRFNDVTSNDTI